MVRCRPLTLPLCSITRSSAEVHEPMHADATQYELSTATSLESVLRLLAAEPGRHIPIAGGTELMVAFNTGRLNARSLISIQHLRELRFIRVEEHAIHMGAGATFTDLRAHEAIARDLPLLSQAASWTGSIANQNRGTLGGNLCNASPAADTPPALLAYDAEVTMVSSAGQRTLPYREFHLGYKRTALRPNELLHSITVPRAFSQWQGYIRKVGTRNAQAISKTALAAVAHVESKRIVAVRVGAASLADRPLRLTEAEEILQNASLTEETLDTTVRLARAAIARQSRPIDDIRSTARYRVAVAANLLEEFIRQLAALC